MPDSAYPTWTLALCNTDDSLLRPLLDSAARQSVPPAEVLVVDTLARADASPDSDAAALPVRRLRAAAVCPSAQRNQILAACATPLIFFAAPGSRLYPDAAERLLRLFAADARAQIAAVAAASVDVRPPSGPQSAEAYMQSFVPATARRDASAQRSLIERLVRKVLVDAVAAEGIYAPADGRQPPESQALPRSLARAGAEHAGLPGIDGTLWRADVLRAVKFDESLEGAQISNIDACHRAARLGLLLRCPESRVYVPADARAAGEYEALVSAAVDVAQLHCRRSHDLSQSRRAFLRTMRTRFVSALLADVGGGRWSLPSARGVIDSVRFGTAMFSLPSEGREHLYRAVYDELAAGPRARSA